MVYLKNKNINRNKEGFKIGKELKTDEQWPHFFNFYFWQSALFITKLPYPYNIKNITPYLGLWFQSVLQELETSPPIPQVHWIQCLQILCSQWDQVHESSWVHLWPLWNYWILTTPSAHLMPNLKTVNWEIYVLLVVC